MALNGFGLNAAVQAFPAMYEFGRSLFGQDSASKAQAFKEKQAEIELALKQREMDDNAAYRQGVLAAQNYSNETQRIGTDNTYKIGDRTVGVSEYLAPFQGAHYNAQNRLSGVQADRITAMTPVEVQEGQARIGQIGAQTNRINTMTPWEAQEAQSRIQLQGAQGGLIGAQTVASRDANSRANERQPWDMRGLKADVNKAELGNRWEQEYFDDEKRHQRFEADPFDRSLSPEDRRRVEIQRSIQFNPHAAEAVQAFDEASNRYVATGDAKAFSPEVVAAVGRGIQPLLDLNTNYAPGTLQFNGFEPVEGGVRVRLQKKTPDGRVEQTYLTEDRGNLSEGSNPKVFSGQELHQMLGGLREIAGAQANNPEYASLQQDMDQARKMSRNRVEYEHNLYTLRSQRAQNQRTAEKDAQSDADKAQKALEHAAAMRGALAKDALDELDAIHPISQMRPEEGKPTPQYQQLMQARARLDAAIRSATADAEPGELIRAHPTDVFNIPEVNKALNEYQDAYNRFQPPVEGALGIQGAPPRPAQTGGFVNPRYPQGGGVGPLSQAAPNQGGNFQPASYPHTNNAGGVLQAHLQRGKSHDHISHLRGPFADRLAAMLEDAPPGVEVMSGYRSPERQAQLWEAALRKYGSPERARKWVAPPGHSNHNHGIASDLTFSSPAAKRWVHQNAKKYGLRFRMAHEGWHIEPIDAHGDDANWGRTT